MELIQSSLSIPPKKPSLFSILAVHYLNKGVSSSMPIPLPTPSSPPTKNPQNAQNQNVSPNAITHSTIPAVRQKPSHSSTVNATPNPTSTARKALLALTHLRLSISLRVCACELCAREFASSQNTIAVQSACATVPASARNNRTR